MTTTYIFEVDSRRVKKISGREIARKSIPIDPLGHPSAGRELQRRTQAQTISYARVGNRPTGLRKKKRYRSVKKKRFLQIESHGRRILFRLSRENTII